MKSDAELDALFAVHVAEMPQLFTLMKRGYYYRPNAAGYTCREYEAWQITEEEADKHVYPHDEPVTKHRVQRPKFTTDANAVLPWLEKCDGFYGFEVFYHAGRYSVRLDHTLHKWTTGAPADTFAHAVVLALLRAKGVDCE